MDRIWRFADLEYSTECGLQSSGASVALQPKVRGLLELLLRAQGATVSKGAIAAALWPTEAISDESLARIVHMLRKALKNAGVDVVRTVYGNGVQLTCPIEEADAEPLPGHAAGVDMLRTVREVAAGRTSAAVAALRFAIGLDPDFASAWVLMADCIAVQAMRGAVAPEAAVLEIGEACGKALKLDPRDAGALAVSGWSLGALSGRLAEGQKRLDQAVAMAPDSYLIRYYRAWVRCLDRDLTDALADIEVAFAAHPLERALLTMHVWLRLCRGGDGRRRSAGEQGGESEARRGHAPRDALHRARRRRTGAARPRLCRTRCGDRAEGPVHAQSALLCLRRGGTGGQSPEDARTRDPGPGWLRACLSRRAARGPRGTDRSPAAD